MDVWAMRLQGGILLQCPRIITSGRVGLCRLAWLPEVDKDDAQAQEKTSTSGVDKSAKLLRVEASILALEPVIDEENDVMLGFYPPELASLRCDVLQKYGELENVSIIEKLRNMGELGNSGTGELNPLLDDDDGDDNYKSPNGGPEQKDKNDDVRGGDNDPIDDDTDQGRAIRNALQL
jgi:hypothetical protein